MWSRQSSPTVAVAEKSVETPHVFLDKVVDMPMVCNKFIAEMVEIPARNRDRYLTFQWQR